MMLGSVNVSPLSSVCPWLAPQMAVHSCGLPYSRPEIAQRESPGWTWTSWSAAGEDELERSDAAAPGVVAVVDAGWYTAVIAVRGASPAASGVTARGGSAREVMSWRPMKSVTRSAPASRWPGLRAARWRPGERRTSATASVTRDHIR